MDARTGPALMRGPRPPSHSFICLQVVFIDTFHLFDETLEFLKVVEQHYAFQAHVYRAAG